MKPIVKTVFKLLPQHPEKEVEAAYEYVTNHPVLGMWQKNPRSEPKRFLPMDILVLRIRQGLERGVDYHGAPYASNYTETEWEDVMNVMSEEVSKRRTYDLTEYVEMRNHYEKVISELLLYIFQLETKKT